MVDEKNNNSVNIDITKSPALLSDETIDELGYARFTANSGTCLPTSQSIALSAIVVTGPTKSPPPVLMPRPRPAIHPTHKLTDAFAHHEPTLSPVPSVEEYPEQPPSTYLTPPLAPILKPVSTPTPGGLSTQQQTNGEIEQQQLPFCGTTSPTLPIISKGDDSNLNHQQISGSMATQPLDSQSEEQETTPIQHPPTDNARSLARKPGVMALTASTSAPLVSSPLVKSTLASQLSSSSSSSSAGSEQQHKKEDQKEPKEQQPRQQRRLRKSLSTEQLPKSDRSDFHHPPSPQQHVPGVIRPTIEKVIHTGNGKSTLQQLQQEYLLRQNGYLRRQVDALKFDNMESQRQHQELATRMKQLEIQLLEEKKRQTPQQRDHSFATNKYQHHHYYHHNVFAPPMDHSSDEEEEQQQYTTPTKQSAYQTSETVDANMQEHRRQHHDGYRQPMDHSGELPEDYMERHPGPTAATKKPQHPINQQKRPLVSQRRHSSHIAPLPSTSDPGSSPTQQRPRPRHVTAPSRPSHYRDQQLDQRGWNRQRSRSVPKNEHSPQAHFRQQGDRTLYLDDNAPRYHHPKGMFPPPPPHYGRPQGPRLDDTDDMDSGEELDLGPDGGFENVEDYYYDDDDDEEDYLEDLDYYRYHMAPGPPMMYYPRPPPPPDVFFNDPYATMPPMGLPPPPLPLHRRKSASALRSSRAGPQEIMDMMNSEHYERPPRQPMRRKWNHPQANQLRKMHMTPPSPRQHHGYRADPALYGPMQRGRPPSTTMSIAPPPLSRSGAAPDHHLSRKQSVMASPRMTALPLRRPMMTRGSSAGSYPSRA